MGTKDISKYEDIIDLPHPVSDHHPRMTNYDRAAQFSPFAALTGLEEEMGEAARLTEAMSELTESRKEELDRVLQQLRRQEAAEISVTWFQKDLRKSGGAYITSVGRLKRIEEYAHSLLLADGTVIAIGDILNIRQIE